MGAKGPLIIPADGDYGTAAEVFRAGGVIAYPTETFYGLCVDPFNPEAVDALFRLKGRPAESPIPLIIGGLEMLSDVAQEATEAARRLMERFWPGPLTIVMKAGERLPQTLSASTGTIGVRLPGSQWARRLSLTLSSPITSTSANPSGKRPPVSAGEVLEYFNGAIGVLIDGGELEGKKGSTVVDATGEKLKIIREGEIPSSLLL